MTKLHQIIAVEETAKRDGDLTPAYHTLQKPALFSGFRRTYSPMVEEGVKYPEETNKVQANAKDLLAEALKGLGKLINVTGTKDVGNCKARADIMVDGVVLAKDVPATHILFLEKKLVDLRTLVSKLPVLDASKDWTYDPAKGCYITPPDLKFKTKKTYKSLVKIEPGPHSPGQAEIITVDEIEGTWSQVDMSTAIPADTVRKLNEKISKLEIALKTAREHANSVEIDNVSHGEKILGYIFDNLTV
jgi:hypothetical protein